MSFRTLRHDIGHPGHQESEPHFIVVNTGAEDRNCPAYHIAHGYHPNAVLQTANSVDEAMAITSKSGRGVLLVEQSIAATRLPLLTACANNRIPVVLVGKDPQSCAPAFATGACSFIQDGDQHNHGGEVLKHTQDHDKGVDAADELLDELLTDIGPISRKSRKALLRLLTLGSPYAESGGHVQNVQCIVQILSRASGRSRKQVALDRFGAATHDIGKVATPVKYKPGPLTAEERLLIQGHTVIGAEIIEAAMAEIDEPAACEMLAAARAVARSHHERPDGKGYPDGLSGDAIDFAARLTSPADVYDALRSARCYKAELRPEIVLAEMMNGNGMQFDEDVLRLLIKHRPEVEALYKDNETAGRTMS